MRRTLRKQIRETGRFNAVGSDGRTYLVVELTEFEDTTTFESKTTEWLATQKSYRLNDGSAVNRNSDTELTVVATGVRLTRQQ
jgi:hypothetical protein